MRKAFYVVIATIALALLIPLTAFGKTKLDKIKQDEYYALFDDLENIDDGYLEEWFLSYVELCDTYDIERETVDTIYSDEEIELMLKAIETEVYGGTFIQKVNIANVLLNRYQKYETFGYTDMCDVVTHKGQFAYYRSEITEETINALNFAFEIRDTTNGSIAFRSDKKVESWNGWEYEFYDGAHWFYKLAEEGDKRELREN